MDVLPTKETWELDDATVKSALRFQLGVSPGPPSHSFYRCACDYQGSDAHHAITYDKLAGLRTLRHDHVQSSVQYGARMAGHSSSIEPQERHLKDFQSGDDGCVGIFLFVHLRTVRIWILSLLTLLVGHLGVELIGHQGRRLVWLRRANGGAMQLEVLGAIGLFLLRSRLMGAWAVLL